MKKNKSKFILKILGGLFIIFIALFIANISGYYESKIRDQVIITEQGIKEFEEKVSSGEEIDINSFLSNEKVDYANKVSKFGENITEGIEKIVTNGYDVIENILKSLF